MIDLAGKGVIVAGARRMGAVIASRLLMKVRTWQSPTGLLEKRPKLYAKD